MLERRAMSMLTIEGLIAVLSFGATMFGLGFAMGSYDNHKNTQQKAAPYPAKLRAASCCNYLNGLTVYRRRLL